jgi:predicted NBD/HSP70 family sugar kinase
MSALVAALAEGRPEALRAVERAGRSLGVAVASTARVVNIQTVVLGGHFAVLERWLRPSLTRSLAKYAPGKVFPEHITVAAVEEGGALLGAAGSVVRSLVEAPHRLQS